jgi:5-hydroxyisourate hydrolase
MAGGISLHAVDVVTGRAAEGMAVSIHRLSPDPALVAAGDVGANGTLDHPVVDGAGITKGIYQASFSVGGFYQSRGQDCRFLDEVPFRFVITDEAEHIHLPLKFSPWGLALFRGV